MNATSASIAVPSHWSFKILAFLGFTIFFSFGYYYLFQVAWIVWIIASIMGGFAFLFSWTELEDSVLRTAVFFSITTADIVGQPILFAILGSAQ